jgi:hypothetical protein
MSVRPGPETHIPKKVPGSKRKKSSLCNFFLLSLAAKGKKVSCVTSSSCPWQQKEKKK